MSANPSRGPACRRRGQQAIAVDSPAMGAPTRPRHQASRGPSCPPPAASKVADARCFATAPSRGRPTARRPWTRPCVQDLCAPHLKAGSGSFMASRKPCICR